MKLGYTNVYRDPYGYPEWQPRGLPVARAPAGLTPISEESRAPGPLYGLAMIWVRKLMGWVSIGMAAYFLRPILPGQGGTVLIALVATAAGLHLGWIDKSQIEHFHVYEYGQVLLRKIRLLQLLIPKTGHSGGASRYSKVL